MKADQPKPVDLSISSAEFDRLMRKALQVAPEDAAGSKKKAVKPKRAAKAKPSVAAKAPKG